MKKIVPERAFVGKILYLCAIYEMKDRMDYTKLPRYFVFKDRKDIDEYDVQTITPEYERVLKSIGEKPYDGFKTIDQQMFEAVESSYIVQLDGARKYVCDIFNTAHYITTLILMEKHPMLNFRTYLDKADEVGAEHGRKDPNHIPLQGMTMALVYNYLRTLNPKYLNLVDFEEKLENYFSSRFTPSEAISYSMGGKMEHSVVQAILAEQLFNKNLLTLEECQALAIKIEDFQPRPIDEVLQESNYEDIYGHLDYIEERMKKLPPEKLPDAPKLAAQVIWRTAHEALQGAMPDAAKDVRRMVSIALDRLGVPDFPEELALELEGIDLTEEEQVPESAENDPEREKEKTIQELQDRLKEAEEKAGELQQRLDSAENSAEEVEKGKQVAEREKKEKEDMIVELLLPIFYGIEKDVRDFLEKVKELEDTQITALVREWVELKKISDQSKRRKLWSVLHAARLYRSTESNWNDQV